MLKGKTIKLLNKLRLSKKLKIALIKLGFIKRETCIISGIFGRNFTKVYPAVKGVKCYFFSNNKKIKDEVISKGWIFVYLPFEQSNDIAVSSFQSKYIKFLQFLDEKRFSFFKVYYDKLIYVDHKFYIQSTQVEQILQRLNKPVFIRKTALLKLKIWDEYNMAMGQERYKRFQQKTLDYINDKLANGYSEDTRICNTGLICYDLSSPDAFQLTNDIYQDLLEVGTSECQIIWGMVSQKHSNIIQTIDWQSLQMIWKAPS